MPVLIDDDFQTYSVGANAPFGPYASGGSLAGIGVVAAVVVNTPVGVFGDVKSVKTPAVQCLQFPSASVQNTAPYYQQFSVYQAFQIGSANGTSENGVVLSFQNLNQPFSGAALATLKIFGDGTLAFTTENELYCYAVSDFSLLIGQWYFFRIDISFSVLGSGNFGYTCTWYVDGIAQLSVTNNDTGIASAGFPYSYVNAIVMGGAGGGGYIGRTTVYSTIQAAGFYPHPGSPVARVTQGVIELMTSTVPGPPTPPFPPGPLPGPPVPGPCGCAEQSKLSVQPGLSVAGTAPPSIPGQTNSLKSQL
jgi:hypothetical protein